MINLAKFLEKKYEAISDEPWSALETRVRQRHAEFFAMFIDEEE